MAVSNSSDQVSRRVSYIPEMSTRIARVTSAGDEESLKSVWRTLRKRQLWILGFACGGIGLAVLACLMISTQYQSTTTVQVGKDPTVQVALSSTVNGPTLSQSDTKTDIATHMAVLQDSNTAIAVIRELGLESRRPFAYHPTLLGWITGNNKKIEVEKNLPLEQSPARRERILKIFARKLIIKNPPDTRLITVAFLNPDPQLAAQISNAVVREYVHFESADQGNSEGIQVLTAQLDGLKERMNQAQNDLVDYERQTGLNSMILKSMGQGSGGGNITHIPVLDRLDTLNQSLTQAEANRIGKEAIYRLTKTHNAASVAGLANSTIPAIANSAVITQGNGLELLQNLRQQQNALTLQYSASKLKYGEKNPHMIELETQLVTVNKQINDELEQISLRARNDYRVAQQNEDGLRAAFQQQQSDAGKLNESAVTLQLLVEQASSTRKLYNDLDQQIQEANVRAGLRATNIRIVDPARPKSSRQRPNPPVYVAIGLAAGLLFGVSSAFVREHMNETVQTPLQVNPLTPLRVLASIPRPTRPKMLSPGGGLLQPALDEVSPLIARPRSSAAEAFRALRTSIMRAPEAHSLKTLAVTSPLIGEGKTSVAYNLAIAFAHAGENVLLIDADLHHPRLHEYFATQRAPGLVDVLTGAQSAQAAIHKHAEVSRLSLLPAGQSVATPAELLGSEAFDSLLTVLKQTYSMIIMDTPPILLVADASVLAGKADSTLAVIRADVTNRTAVERLTELLESSGGRAIGVVLNGVDTTSIDFYHAFGHNGAEKYFEEN